MTDIFEEALIKVNMGARFTVDFQARTFKLDGRTIINAGKYEGDLGVDKTGMDMALNEIEELYSAYLHSVPSERSENGTKRYFRALKEHELSDNDMLYGMPRELARLKLELFTLCCILNGSLVWDDRRLGKWFWQSAKYPSLVILKQWIA